MDFERGCILKSIAAAPPWVSPVSLSSYIHLGLFSSRARKLLGSQPIQRSTYSWLSCNSHLHGWCTGVQYLIFFYLSLSSERLLLVYLSIGLKNSGWIDIMTHLIRSFIYTFLNLMRLYIGQRRGPLWLGIFGMGGSILLGISNFVFGRLGIRAPFFDMTTLGHQHNSDDLLVYCTIVTW